MFSNFFCFAVLHVLKKDLNKASDEISYIYSMKISNGIYEILMTVINSWKIDNTDLVSFQDFKLLIIINVTDSAIV